MASPDLAAFTLEIGGVAVRDSLILWVKPSQ